MGFGQRFKAGPGRGATAPSPRAGLSPGKRTRSEKLGRRSKKRSPQRAEGATPGRDLMEGTDRPSRAQLLGDEAGASREGDGGGQPAAAPSTGDDFAIEGTFDPEGEEEWEDHVFFDLGSSDLEGPQKQRLAAIAARLPLGPETRITLVGYSSEEGGDDENTRLASARTESVADELIRSFGHEPGQVVQSSVPWASEGRIRYRQWRAVEVHVGSADLLDCSVEPETEAFGGERRMQFVRPLGLALRWLQEALAGLSERDPPAAVARFFGDEPPIGEIRAGIEAIRGQVADLSASPPTVATECHNNCQGNINAFVRGGDEVTLCPQFFDQDEEQQARILIHEAAHFKDTVDAGDRAYGWERLIDHLSTEEALDNADSYALLVMRLAGVDNVSRASPDRDDFTGLGDSDHESEAAEAIAYAQRWLTATRVIINHLYASTHRALERRSNQWPTDLVRDKMRFLSQELGLSFQHNPTEEDKRILAGINDRVSTMMDAMRGSSLEITSASDSTEWEPGPGSRVAIHPSLWTRSLRVRIRLLLRRLVEATPEVGRGMSGGYVNMFDDFRKVQNNGP